MKARRGTAIYEIMRGLELTKQMEWRYAMTRKEQAMENFKQGHNCAQDLLVKIKIYLPYGTKRVISD